MIQARSARVDLVSQRGISPSRFWPPFPYLARAKERAYLRGKGIDISHLEEERLDPDRAFERARSAVDWLLKDTLPDAKRSLLFDENIAYGFHRNLYGIKPLAIGVVLIALAAHGALIATSSLDETTLRTSFLIAGVLVTLLGTWCFLVSQSAVTDASLAYAQKLFAQCEISQPPRSTQAGGDRDGSGTMRKVV
jgi:hypothetical protein